MPIKAINNSEDSVNPEEILGAVSESIDSRLAMNMLLSQAYWYAPQDIGVTKDDWRWPNRGLDKDNKARIGQEASPQTMGQFNPVIAAGGGFTAVSIDDGVLSSTTADSWTIAFSSKFSKQSDVTYWLWSKIESVLGGIHGYVHPTDDAIAVVASDGLTTRESDRIDFNVDEQCVVFLTFESGESLTLEIHRNDGTVESSAVDISGYDVVVGSTTSLFGTSTTFGSTAMAGVYGDIVVDPSNAWGVEERLAIASALALTDDHDYSNIRADFEISYAREDDFHAPIKEEIRALSDASAFEATASVFRVLGGSGVVAARQYTSNLSLDAEGRKHDGAYAALNLHSHANYSNMCGLAESAWLVNGYPNFMRHQDYKFRKTIAADDYEFGVELTEAPDVPVDILALPTGVAADGAVDLVSNTQARAIKNIRTERPEDCKFHLAYAEFWFEAIEAEEDEYPYEDRGDSFRHADAYSTLGQMHDTISTLNLGGAKERTENAPSFPIVKRLVDESGREIAGYFNSRIMTCEVGTLAPTGVYDIAPLITIRTANSHSHILSSQLTDQEAADLRDGTVSSVTLESTDVGHSHSYVITWDGVGFVGADQNGSHQHDILFEEGYDGSLPFDFDEALAGTTSANNVFVPIWDDVSLDEYGSKDAVLNSRSARFKMSQGLLERVCERVPGLDGEGAFNEEETLNSGVSQDRDGGVLNAAYYTHTYNQETADASGRTPVHRGFNDPNLFTAKTTKKNVIGGYSMMVPIELVLLTPENSWNPHDIAEVAAKGDVTGFGGTAAFAYSASSEDERWYRLPVGMYSAAGIPDPADTSDTKWMLDSAGVAQLCYPSGIHPFTWDGLNRVRFPVYPVWQEYEYSSVRLEKAKGRIEQLELNALSALAEYADDTAASSDGLSVGDHYINSTTGSVTRRMS